MIMHETAAIFRTCQTPPALAIAEPEAIGLWHQPRSVSPEGDVMVCFRLHIQVHACTLCLKWLSDDVVRCRNAAHGLMPVTCFCGQHALFDGCCTMSHGHVPEVLGEHMLQYNSILMCCAQVQDG